MAMTLPSLRVPSRLSVGLHVFVVLTLLHFAVGVTLKTTHAGGTFFPLGRLFMDSADKMGKPIGRIRGSITVMTNNPEFEMPEYVSVLIYLGTKSNWGMARSTQDCEIRHALAHQELKMLPDNPDTPDELTSTQDVMFIPHESGLLPDTSPAFARTRLRATFVKRYTLKTQDVLAARENWRGFYFFAFATETCEDLPDVNYSINVRRIDTAWSAEFGLNQTGLNTLYAVFFPLYVLLLAMHFYSVRKLTATRPIVHPVLKTFTMTLFIEFLSLVGHMIHYLQYTNDGIGAWTLSRTCTIVDVIARTTFLFILIAVANGWAVTNLEIEHLRTVWFIVALFCGLSIGHSIFEFASNTPLDLGPPDGAAEFEIVVAILGLALAVWFIVSAIRTMRFTNDEVKRNFLLLIVAVYGLYCASIPTVALLSANLKPQLRNKAPVMFTHVVTYMGLAGMVSRFWYTRSPKIFLFDTQEVDTEPDFQRL